jgi:CheY-like chemotaxis protein
VGLSLTICQHLVAQLAGRLTAKSIVGRGTRMTVSIPLKQSSKEAKHATPMPKTVPSIAFLGFETPSKRLFVEKFLEQFHIRETKDISNAHIVIISFDDPHLQVPYERDIDVITQRETRPEIIIMPPLFLQELEEERSIRLEMLQSSLTQESRILHRPMTVQEIREMGRLIEEIKISQIHLQGSESMGMAVPTLSSILSSHLLRITEESARRASGSSASSDRPSADHPFEVLVVEDNPLNARIMTTMLKKANINYKLAQNGKEGVEMFEKHLPVLVLLDINMPIMNGFDACKAMRAVQSPFIHRIVAITALSSEYEKRKGRECGMDEWLTKPTRIAPLMRKMKREFFLHLFLSDHTLKHLVAGWRSEFEGVATSDPSTPSATSAASLSG